MLGAPVSPSKMSHDPATGTVIYRSKMHLGLKRNFQLMLGAKWLELLCRHIPDHYEHLVRYVGWYSNRARGERAKAQHGEESSATPVAASLEALNEIATRAKAATARLIRKVYEADCCRRRCPPSRSSRGPVAPRALRAALARTPPS